MKVIIRSKQGDGENVLKYSAIVKFEVFIANQSYIIS